MLKPIANLVLKLFGWRVVGELPSFKKAVFIAAPHTSNWDGFWLLIAKIVLDLELRFLAKESLFWWPLGPILSHFGAIPLDRDVASSTVQQLVDAFEREERLNLALAPEGTRSWRPQWKSGFYQIAKAANVPIVLAFIDYSRKEMGIGITLPMGQSPEEDLQTIRDFYKPFVGRHPERSSAIEFPLG